MHVLAGGLAAILALLSLLHVYWAVRGTGGTGSAALPERDGKPLFVPGPASSLAVAALLAAAAGIVLQRAGVGPQWLPDRLNRIGVWTVAAVFLLRAMGDFRYVGFFKRVRGTRFATLDTFLYSPITLMLGAGTAVIARDGG